jgi:glyoxylase-like metal-dependent hydrolase (beta-lactamase superfamily II)
MDREIFDFRVGETACRAVLDGTGLYSPEFFFANLRREDWEPRLAERGASTAAMEIPYTCLLIETGGRRLLIDTGAGGYAPTTGRLVANLHACGLDPHDIDIVVLSHAHPDHVAGLLDGRGALVYTRARCVMFKREWDFWMSDPDLSALPLDARVKDTLRAVAVRSLSAIEHQLDFVEPGGDIAPGVTAVAAFGHTPGHMAVQVRSAGETLLFVADAFGDPIAVEHPEARCLTDTLAEETVETRRRLIEKAAIEGALVSTSHCPFPGVGRIERRSHGWRWVPIVPA